MRNELEHFSKYLGTFVGHGINHEGLKFTGTLELRPQIAGKGLSIDYVAKGEDGTAYHREHSILGFTPMETLSLWVMSSNHPGVIEHRLHPTLPVVGASKTYHFNCGDFNNENGFRETVAIDLWPNGDLSYRYSWGMPGGEFKERSGLKMLAGKNRPIPEEKPRVLNSENDPSVQAGTCSMLRKRVGQKMANLVSLADLKAIPDLSNTE